MHTRINDQEVVQCVAEELLDRVACELLRSLDLDDCHIFK